MSVISNTPTVGSMVLLLLQLISVCLFPGTGISEEIIDTEHNITLEVGTRGILPCHFQGRSYEVEWKKQRTPNFELLVSLDTLFNVGARDGPGYEAGLFNITDDYSLVINEVKVQDEGLYLCTVSDYETGIPIQKWTRVYVQAYPGEPVIEECIGKYVHPEACTLTVGSSSTLTCFVERYYPDLELYFLHGSDLVTSPEYREWNNTDGTKNKNVTIFISASDEPYQCVASGLPGIAGNKTVSVFVKARSQDPIAAVIVVSVVLGVCLSIAVGFICYRRNGRVSCSRHDSMPVPSLTRKKAPKGLISKLELWKLVKEAKESNAHQKLKRALHRLRRLPKTAASKALKNDDYYESLCMWKSDTSSDSDQRKTLYSACCKVGMSDISRKLKDFVMDTSDEVSRVNMEHILWDIQDMRKISELLKALGLDHEAVALAHEKGRREVIAMALKELLKWRNREFEINPTVTLSLTLDDLQCETNFFKIQMSKKEEIHVDEIKEICCQISKQHYTYLLKAIRDNHGEDIPDQIEIFVNENNVSLFNTSQMIHDWLEDEECSDYEKRSKLQKASKATSQRYLKDAKWPPDDELRVIANLLSPASMGKLCSKLGIRRPPLEANEEQRFQALIEWRDNQASAKDLREKHTELFTVFKELKQGGLISRAKGKLVYKAELVDLAFHLFAQDLLPFTEALGISAAELITYKPAFHPLHMTLGTIGLVCKLSNRIFDQDTGQRSRFFNLLKQMQYQNVCVSGMLALEISYGEVCAIGLHFHPDSHNKQPTIQPSSINSNSITEEMRFMSSGAKPEASHIKIQGDATYHYCVQRHQINIYDETTSGLTTLLTATNEVEDHNNKSTKSLKALDHFKSWRDQPRLIPFNCRLAITKALRSMDNHCPVDTFLQGDCNRGKVPFILLYDMFLNMGPSKRDILGKLLVESGFTEVLRRVSMIPQGFEDSSHLTDAVFGKMHEWIEKWIQEMKSKGSDLPTAEIAKKHKEFNDKLVDHGFFDLAREIMICEQQLINE